MVVNNTKIARRTEKENKIIDRDKMKVGGWVM